MGQRLKFNRITKYPLILAPKTPPSSVRISQDHTAALHQRHPRQRPRCRPPAPAPLFLLYFQRVEVQIHTTNAPFVGEFIEHLHKRAARE